MTGNTASGCAAHSGSQHAREDEGERKLKLCLGRIRHKILVMSGKGGVGKSTIAANIAASLAASGKKVGLLDVDFHGPSIPTLFGLQKHRAIPGRDGLLPAEAAGVKIMSIAFLLDKHDDAVIWRGPMKAGAIKQLLSEVDWGELDYLIIDSPPGTGDEPLSVCQTIKEADGAVIVTTPQELSVADVRRSVTFCRQLAMPVIGIIENMSGFVCPKCGETVNIFKTGGGEDLARQADIRFLGKIPLDPHIAESGDAGEAYISKFAQSEVSSIFARIIAPLMELSHSGRG